MEKFTDHFVVEPAVAEGAKDIQVLDDAQLGSGEASGHTSLFVESCVGN